MLSVFVRIMPPDNYAKRCYCKPSFPLELGKFSKKRAFRLSGSSYILYIKVISKYKRGYVTPPPLFLLEHRKLSVDTKKVTMTKKPETEMPSMFWGLLGGIRVVSRCELFRATATL